MAPPVKPRPRPRTRQGKPPTAHEGVATHLFCPSTKRGQCLVCGQQRDAVVHLSLLRTTERKDFKRCPQRWWWGWREGLKPTGPPNDKLWYGTGWHLVMAHRYGLAGTRRGREPLKVWRDWLGEEIPKIRINISGTAEYREEVYVDAGKLGEEMIGNYLDTYGTDPKWHMIQVEKPFEVVITDSTGTPRVLFCGTYDGVYRDLRDDTFWLLEHKTAKSIPSTGFLELDDQAGGYLTVAARELADAGLIPKGKQIKGIMYNFARKSVKDTRPVNSDGLATNLPTKQHYLEQLSGSSVHPKMTIEQLKAHADRLGIVVLGEVSKVQPVKLFHREAITRTVRERNTIVEHMQAEVQHMEAVRSGSLPLYKTPTRDCSWDCNFYRMCVMHEGGGPDWEEFKASVFHTEDPYADHRKSAAGDD